MSSDADYGAFLDQANQDTGSASAAAAGKKAKLKTIDSAVPPPLKQIDAYYVSDADEPFEPVSLKWDGGGVGDLDEKSFVELVGHEGQVEAMSTKEFDPKGQYQGILDTVKKEVGGGEVKVFRVETGKSRAEYWAVGVREGKVMGVRASAVES